MTDPLSNPRDDGFPIWMLAVRRCEIHMEMTDRRASIARVAETHDECPAGDIFFFGKFLDERLQFRPCLGHDLSDRFNMPFVDDKFVIFRAFVWVHIVREQPIFPLFQNWVLMILC